MNFTYMLRCGDGSIYTGWTNDIRRRLEDHRNGTGAKYTRGRGPLELIYLEVSNSRQEAMQLECTIKKLKKIEKLALAETSGWKEKLASWSCEDVIVCTEVH